MAGVRERFRMEQIHAYLWLIHTVVWQKPTQHCRAIISNYKTESKGQFLAQNRCLINIDQIED